MDFEKMQESEQIENYLESAKTLKELEGRKKTLEMLNLMKNISINNSLKLQVKGDSQRADSKIIDGIVVQKMKVLLQYDLKTILSVLDIKIF